MDSVDANRKDVGITKGVKSLAQKGQPLHEATAGSTGFKVGPGSTCTAVPGRRWGSGTSGPGLRSPSQATMFQISEQHPPTPKVNLQNFLFA